QSGAYEQVIEGVEAALAAGLDPVKLNMVVFEGTKGYLPEMIDHVAENEGLQLQLIEYMPELVGNPEWAVDTAAMHDWLAEQADRVEHREMHDRKRYFVSSESAGSSEGMVEVVDPVGNEEFCANCHRVRVTHDGHLKGCLNRTDDLRSMGEMTRAEIRETFRETVENRVPYYGEYMVEEDGEWVLNDEYLEPPPAADD
ncbi:MAG: GTP 3',8-cyclase MoaA, partial [Haloarculaceae archaeon]